MERVRPPLTYVVVVALLFVLSMVLLGFAALDEMQRWTGYAGIPLIIAAAELIAVGVGLEAKRPRALAKVTLGVALISGLVMIFVPYWPADGEMLEGDRFAIRMTGLAICFVTAVLMTLPLIRKDRLGEPHRDAGYAIAGR